MKKVMLIFGTRPEAIKMLPIVKEFENNNHINCITVVTGQHREMLDQVLTVFDTKPDHDLGIMSQNQSLSDITVNIISNLNSVITKELPDMILVHGDTTTTFAASLFAFYNRIPIGHVEAGLRTWDKYSPFPEEVNRQLTDVLSDLYFAPTEASKLNLLKENHSDNQIFITGNTVIDALKYSVKEDFKHEILDNIRSPSRIILLTMHRRENIGQPMENVFKGILEIVKKNKDVEIIFPVHLNPQVRHYAFKYFDKVPQVHLVDPLNMVEFHNITSRSYMILTDSGGVQEEAPSLGKPVLVLREETERPEGVEAGTLKIVGTSTETIIKEIENLLFNEEEYQKMSEAKNPYGDGEASQRIVKIIEEYFSQGMQSNKKHRLSGNK
ncbi:non-hydrolyzing UDP-N-acetylglucosamine 2-epimerase [Lactococcus garvieae]|uniref:non-hydrolyzing UDP-N-acetylglucosamine 2-epimerase n=1 Tax=Lactococcus garvieae TaxID=1363 RepID=UPI00398F7D91